MLLFQAYIRIFNLFTLHKKRNTWEDTIDEASTDFPLIHYVNKVNTLNFFSQDDNFMIM